MARTDLLGHVAAQHLPLKSAGLQQRIASGLSRISEVLPASYHFLRLAYQGGPFRFAEAGRDAGPKGLLTEWVRSVDGGWWGT
ncbi:hypothetical protein GCM10027511_18630 [Hymenobacter humi]